MKIILRRSAGIEGFTLVELLVVIGVLVMLSGFLLIIINPIAQLKKTNDTQRKSDLHQIRLLLEQYYSDHGRYPSVPAVNCGSGGWPNCYEYSFPSNTAWIPELVPAYTPKLPLDPVNNVGAPWVGTNFSYAYGNVSPDGQTFDLFTDLESSDDPDRCGLKDYIYGTGLGTPPTWPKHWCTAFGGAYSNQVYAVQSQVVKR